ncbi:SDR family NAD(P)-dependent oxidoreductase [Mycobacterium helveticum]|uniref:3-oxoacyl-[acyl-carrier-protein] reductase MabA n=1 Tax=Mycobacterium helveticum TaxID=2592811 RepID=A0A557XR94_9MYCO|nr:SDR family oxidoreductase [Mycobacterium helveticum]TVS85076.1 SDR family oxidoreductase [Mycobacterium helveticum]TVS88453.1 SDR family oxidoreductase [Mycobacterium helveticum]
MRIELSGRRSLVSGSTAGIGYAIARGLAGAGARVVINGRTGRRVDEAVARLRDEVPGADIAGVAADVGTRAGIAELLEQEPDVDVLVANAGIFEPKPFAEITDDDWQRFFDVNVMGAVRLARHYVPRMAARGWGRAVFISSESALHIPAEMVHYGVTKTALLAVARGLAESYPASGVTVNSVLPGPTRSEGVATFLKELAGRSGQTSEDAEREFLATERPTSLLGRFATTDEVANLVVYVCSPQAAATTGAALRVDGGVVRAIP